MKTLKEILSQNRDKRLKDIIDENKEAFEEAAPKVMQAVEVAVRAAKKTSEEAHPKVMQAIGKTLPLAVRAAKETFEEALPKVMDELAIIFRAGLFVLEYERTGNIIYVLKIMKIYREAGKTPPDGVVDYMADFTERMMALFDDEDKTPNATGVRAEKLVADCFFDNGKVWGNVEKYRNFQTKTNIYQDVIDTRKAIKAGRIKLKKGESAYDIVGGKYDKGRDRIKQIYQEIKKKGELPISEYLKNNRL